MSARPPVPDRPTALSDSPRFHTGRLLGGRYEIVDLIGEGATAEVFRARDHRLDRIVAVKVLRPQYGRDADARERFAIEARTAAGLAVSNIVPVYDFGATDDGSLFIVMRLIDGPSLRQVLAERGALPVAQVVDIGAQVADALAVAHDTGLVHRDVKPGNILLDAAGTAHLTDFGTVKVIAGANELTRTGMTFGTAAYIAPEQATGGPVGASSDLYGLGAVLYEALAGRPPFSGDDPIAVSYRHVHEQAVPIGALVPGLDPELEGLVMECLAKWPLDRPASARRVAATLNSVGRRMAPPEPVSAAPFAAVGLPAWPPELDHETIPMAAQSPPAGAAGPVAPPATRVQPAPVASRQPTGELGVAWTTRSTRSRRRAAPSPVGLILLGLAVLVAAVVVPLVLADRNDAGVALAPTSTPAPTPARTVATPTATAAAVSTPTVTVASPPVVAVPTPTAAPVATAEPTPEPTLQPTAAPTDQPTRAPRPRPTAEPTLPPTPVAEWLAVRFEDRRFKGDYDGSGAGTYHGRTASWVYGQGTPYHTMTASFEAANADAAVGRATLRVVGLDGDDPRKHLIRISLNGQTIYEGPNPLPNDECCGPSGPGNWGSAAFRFPADQLRRSNTLSISNLEPGDCTHCPIYVMVDYAVVEYRVER